MIDAAIFDMDGIIFDTERLYIDAWRSSALEAGFEMRDRFFLSCVGRNDRDTRALTLAEFGDLFPYDAINEGTRQRIFSIMEREGPPEKPGVRRLLDFFKDRKVPVALATSTSEKSARWMMDRSGLSEYFTAFAFGTDVERGKPAPDIFVLAQDRLADSPVCGSPPRTSHICVFEDSEAGLKAAQAAGMRSVFVPDLVEPDKGVLERVWKRITRLDEAACESFFYGL